MKAAASVDFGYQILLTDLKHTYFCAGDVEMVKFEKKVRVNIYFKFFLQQYNPTIQTDEFKDLINLLHTSISKYDANSKYTFIEVSVAPPLMTRNDSGKMIS